MKFFRSPIPSKHVSEAARVLVPRVAPVTAPVESLYGVPIYILGEGFRGQYLRHTYMTVLNERYWIVEYGYATIYAEFKGVYYPVVVHGFPTKYLFQIGKGARFFIEEVPIGIVEFKEKDILNLDRVFEGKDAVLVVDKYGIYRARTPSEYIDRMRELHDTIEGLNRAVQKYEEATRDLETQVRILRSENARLKSENELMVSRLERILTEYVALKGEVVKLREELDLKLREIGVAEDLRVKFRSLLDKIIEHHGEVIKHIEEFKKKGEGGK